MNTTSVVEQLNLTSWASHATSGQTAINHQRFIGNDSFSFTQHRSCNRPKATEKFPFSSIKQKNVKLLYITRRWNLLWRNWILESLWGGNSGDEKQFPELGVNKRLEGGGAIIKRKNIRNERTLNCHMCCSSAPATEQYGATVEVCYSSSCSNIFFFFDQKTMPGWDSSRR